LTDADYKSYLDAFNAGAYATTRPVITGTADLLQGQGLDADYLLRAPNASIIIENKTFYPRPGYYALSVEDQTNPNITVVIRNCLFYGGETHVDGGASAAPGTVAATNGFGIRIKNSVNVRVEGNWFQNLSRVAVDVVGTGTPMNNIVVDKNKALDMQAFDVEQVSAPDPTWPIKWESKFIQFLQVTGSGNMAWDNRAVNRPQKSFSTDFINLYESSGTNAANKLRVVSNKLIGSGARGSYHLFGAGIQLGDHDGRRSGGQWVEATNNLVIYPGLAGMNINGGADMSMANNTVVMSASIFGYQMTCADRAVCPAAPSMTSVMTWTGMATTNYSGIANTPGAINSGHRVSGNRVMCPGCASGASINLQTTTDDGTSNWAATIDPRAEAPAATFFN
jgi:hypothetical protein